ncbi:Urea active transporter [Venturia nashicola]|uniref:Urea active transporter n=1 Tax=Venturia nashicola TaxID=86259 RepID=A0A4Z1P378_9PEZI|nr:Urea active transporter [Venturia nashicola]TLD21595.1 Urea active transporter [Venturia nashicola]
MPSKVEDLQDDVPSNINPYKVLEARSFTSSTITHLLTLMADKVPEEDKEEAKELFQKISFAYGVLSDPRRRSRYDTTGRTNDTLHLDDEDDFNWSDFFRTQFEDLVSNDKIAAFKAEYQGSEEEKLDVIASYVTNEGDMDAIFEEVMLSSPLDDEDRFRKMIDEEINEKRVEAYEAYIKETKTKRKKRVAEAKKEAKEAEQMAEELGVKDKLYGNGKAGAKKGKKGEEDISGLAAIIQQRQKERSGNFLADMEVKFAPKKRGKRVMEDEPPEEAFEATAKRMKKNKRAMEDEPPEEAFEKTTQRAKKNKKTSSVSVDVEQETGERRSKRVKR